MTTREEAAVKALKATDGQFTSDEIHVLTECVPSILAAAEVWERENDIWRFTLDEVTVERCAEYVPHHPDCWVRPSDGNCACKHLRLATVRAVLAAAVKEEV